MSKIYNGLNFKGINANSVYKTMIDEELKKTDDLKIEDVEKTLSENPELNELMQFIINTQSKDEQQILIEAAAAVLFRIRLFNKAVDTITCIGDTHIKDKEGNFKGFGVNIIYDKYTDQSIDFIHKADDTDVIELYVNAEPVFEFSKTSPVLEAFLKLFELMQINE